MRLESSALLRHIFSTDVQQASAHPVTQDASRSTIEENLDSVKLQASFSVSN